MSLRSRSWGRTLIAGAAAVGISLISTSAASAATCPAVVDSAGLASASQLRKLDREVQQLRSAHPRERGPQQVDRLADGQGPRDRWNAHQARSRSRPYALASQNPLAGTDPVSTSAPRAGITVTQPDGSTVNVPDAGAVHWSQPTGKRGDGGPLVYLAARSRPSPPENAAGKVVVRDFQLGSLPVRRRAVRFSGSTRRPTSRATPTTPGRT